MQNDLCTTLFHIVILFYDKFEGCLYFDPTTFVRGETHLKLLVKVITLHLQFAGLQWRRREANLHPQVQVY